MENKFGYLFMVCVGAMALSMVTLVVTVVAFIVAFLIKSWPI